jgi:hypothetical protein
MAARLRTEVEELQQAERVTSGIVRKAIAIHRQRLARLLARTAERMSDGETQHWAQDRTG